MEIEVLRPASGYSLMMMMMMMMIAMIDKVGQLLWAWFSRPRKSASRIVEP